MRSSFDDADADAKNADADVKMQMHVGVPNHSAQKRIKSRSRAKVMRTPCVMHASAFVIVFLSFWPPSFLCVRRRGHLCPDRSDEAWVRYRAPFCASSDCSLLMYSRHVCNVCSAVYPFFAVYLSLFAAFVHSHMLDTFLINLNDLLIIIDDVLKLFLIFFNHF